jgi:hypothetical protein
MALHKRFFKAIKQKNEAKEELSESTLADIERAEREWKGHVKKVKESTSCVSISSLLPEDWDNETKYKMLMLHESRRW